MENREVLENCVRVSELRAIQSEGLDFFRHFFFGMVVLGVSLDDYWPCIYEKYGSVELGSQWVEYPLKINDRFVRVL